MGVFVDMAKQAEEFDKLPMRYALSRITVNSDGTISLNLPQRWLIDVEPKDAG